MSSLSQTAYERIRERITSGEWAHDKPLSEPALAVELQISRTPIREAIHRLESEGLLEQRHRQGTFVRRPSRREMREIFEARILLEPFAAARAARTRNPELLRELEASVSEMKRITDTLQTGESSDERVALLRRHARCDQTFHDAILQHARNRTIYKLANVAGIMSRLWSAPKTRPDQIQFSFSQYADRQHEQILQAIRRGNSVAARKRMREHLVCGRKNALDYFDWLEEQSAAPKQRRRS